VLNLPARAPTRTLSAVPASPIRTPEQQRTYRVRTRPIADPGSLLDRLPAEQPLAWIRRGEGLVGWGVAAELRVRGPERFSRAQRWWNEWCAAADIDDTVSVPGTGPVAFASFAFDEADESVVMLPQVLIGRRGGQAWITTVGDVDLPSAVTSVPQGPDAGHLDGWLAHERILARTPFARQSIASSAVNSTRWCWRATSSQTCRDHSTNATCCATSHAPTHRVGRSRWTTWSERHRNSSCVAPVMSSPAESSLARCVAKGTKAPMRVSPNRC
jgi:hypothetical protein